MLNQNALSLIDIHNRRLIECSPDGLGGRGAGGLEKITRNTEAVCVPALRTLAALTNTE